MSTTPRIARTVIVAVTMMAAAAIFQLMSVGSARLQQIARQAGSSVAAGTPWAEPAVAMGGAAASHHDVRRSTGASVRLASSDR